MPGKSSRGRPSVKELEERYGDARDLSPAVLGRLRRDSRVGARQLYRRLKRQIEAGEGERLRLERMLDLERALWRAGVEHVAGVDEVGIGPMAGPVVAAAVVFPQDVWIDGIDDSKRLDPETREVLDRKIRAVATGLGLGVVDTVDVDRLNVYHAGLEAMRRAVAGLVPAPGHVLVDARTIPGLDQPQNGFPKGDGISMSIAAASIVAKVHRDRMMSALDRRYPGYGFASHKGYCTPEHQRAVERLGPSPIHRRSFHFVRELGGEYSDMFYSLRRQAETVWSREELAAFETRFQAHRDHLSSSERRKLHVLLARRRRRVES